MTEQDDPRFTSLGSEVSGSVVDRDEIVLLVDDRGRLYQFHNGTLSVVKLETSDEPVS